VHRLGPYAPGKVRPIIVRFLHFKDREHIWQNLGHGLIPPKYSKPHIREDFPQEVEEARNILLPIAKAATKIKDPSTRKTVGVKLVTDKLYINNQKYDVHTLHTLPEKLQPQMIFTPTVDNMTAFFTRNSPLSNHYTSPFTLSGEKFNCMEQYMVVQKARVFEDQETVNKVMKETNPVKQKQLGKSIKGLNEDHWQSQAEDMMLPGLLAKFHQNNACKDLLLKTGNNIIIEANPQDKFLGAGVSLFSPDLWSVDKHPGKNIMGKLLQRVRESIRQGY
jgi:ribA/ribD-fused uncharacterized protein